MGQYLDGTAAANAKTAELIAGTDGSNVQHLKTDADGNLQVDVLSSTGAGSDKVEDTAHSTGATGAFVLGVRNDSAAALTSTDGDYSPFATDSAGRMLTDTELPAAAALADNTANPTAPAVAAFPHVFDGVTWDRMPGTSADGVTVKVGSALAPGTNVIGSVRLVEGAVNESGTELAITTTEINATTDGNNTVIAAPGASLKIRVVSLSVTLTGAGTVQVISGATTKMRVRAAADGGGIAIAGDVSAPVFECGTNEAFVVNNPAGVDSLGHVTHVVVPA